MLSGWVHTALLGLLSGVVSCSEVADEIGETKINRPQTLSPRQKPILDPDHIERLQPEVVHNRVTAGKALLVCAYESDIAFWTAELSGAISLQEFQSRLPDLGVQQEIIFYC